MKAESLPAGRVAFGTRVSSTAEGLAPFLREALIALEVEGLVEVRTGASVFVCKPQRACPYHASSEGPLEIMRARISIEGETAAMAARQMRALQIPELRNVYVGASSRDIRLQGSAQVEPENDHKRDHDQ